MGVTGQDLCAQSCWLQPRTGDLVLCALVPLSPDYPPVLLHSLTSAHACPLPCSANAHSWLASPSVQKPNSGAVTPACAKQWNTAEPSVGCLPPASHWLPLPRLPRILVAQAGSRVLGSCASPTRCMGKGRQHQPPRRPMWHGAAYMLFSHTPTSHEPFASSLSPFLTLSNPTIPFHFLAHSTVTLSTLP